MAIESTMNLFVKKTGGWVASQLEACTRCGICAEACPYYVSTGKAEYAPIWKVEPLRRAYEQRFTLTGKMKVALGLEKRLTDDDLKAWSQIDFNACSVCGKCSGACPMGIEISALISTVRAGITAAGYAPASLVEKTELQVKCGSPNGLCENEFRQWFESLETETGIKPNIDVKGADMLIVFTSLEIGAKRSNLYDLVKILEAAGIKWTFSIKARDAFNMGSIIGNPKVQKELAGRILNTAKELGVKQVLVTECGHGFTTLRDAVPNIFGQELPFFVTHVAELLPNLIREGKIKVKEGYFANGHTYTFHDSCKIQRQGGIIDEPRYALKLLAGDTFKEMLPNREDALCCGGGGGLRSIPDATENRMAAFKLKLNQVEHVGADVVVSTCDNCQLQLKDGFKHYNKPVEVKGLIEMVAEAMIV